MSDRYQQLFIHFSEALFVEDGEGLILDANPAAHTLLECVEGALIGRNKKEFLTPASFDRLEPLRRALNPLEHFEADAQYLRAQGGSLNVTLDVALVPGLGRGNGSGQDSSGYLVTVRASSRRDELERELRLQRQSTVVQRADQPHATFFISSRREISRYPPSAPHDDARPLPLHWTPALITGAALKPALDKAWSGENVFLSPEWYSPETPRASDAPVKLDAPDQEAPPLTVRRWLRLSFLPLRLRGTDVTDVCVHVLDCTAERLQSEARRYDDQHRALNLLTEALHHELNNYLSVIVAQASSLRLSLEPGQLAPPHVGAIIDTAQQAASLLRQSQNSGAGVDRALRTIELNGMLADCATLLAHQFDPHLVVFEPAQDVPAVRGNEELLKLMVQLLCRHMRLQKGPAEGAVLLLKTFCAKSAYPGLPPSAGIHFEDQGVINADPVAASSFSQYGSMGETLELTLANSILRQHRGQMESVLTAHGMVWEVTLPGIENTGVPSILKQETQPAPLQIAAVAELAHGEQETIVESWADSTAHPVSHPAKINILLADDEENFRTFTSWVLRENGYEVVTASDGQEAFNLFKAAPHNFSLVILDSYMPRMGGLEAYLRMQILRPELPVLFASGFARGASADALVAGCPGPAAVLFKPFGSEELLAAVKSALVPDAE